MTTEAIVESGMTFGPFGEGECFYVENSQCYIKIQEGVQMAEFLLLRAAASGSVIWIVEAKSSPQATSVPNFADFIEDIRAKLTNGFLLGVSARLQRHPDAATELSDAFKAIDLQLLQFRFVLVINGHKKEWLPPVQDALAIAMRPLVKAWACGPTSVLVFNHEMAEHYGLIQPVGV